MWTVFVDNQEVLLFKNIARLKMNKLVGNSFFQGYVLVYS
jgi:hypothetical protein